MALPPSETVAAPPDVYGWDWTATTHIADHEVDRASEDGWRVLAHDLVDALGGSVALPGKGLQGWGRSVVVYDDAGYKLGTVYCSGRPDVHVQATGSEAEASRWAVRNIGNPGTARVDTRVDTLVPYEELQAICEDVAGPQTKVMYVESKVGGQSTGRTMYVGSPTSAVRVRLYEKWLEAEPGQYDEGTNRVEVQLRPPSRGKQDVTGWTPAETFCASKLTRRLAAELGTELARPGTLQKHKGTPDLERTLAAMGEQYGRAVDRWLRVSSGDVGRVLDHLTGSVAS